ncbi:hypothetical protein OTU49_004846 [Cherax quadricarinatus]|uniref:Uncharacterized protein n=1 Tax=Cherax quadricarinatus TaxID=27406 RepID=A0AAW0X9T4_CHEQU
MMVVIREECFKHMVSNNNFKQCLRVYGAVRTVKKNVSLLMVTKKGIDYRKIIGIVKRMRKQVCFKLQRVVYGREEYEATYVQICSLANVLNEGATHVHRYTIKILNMLLQANLCYHV